MARKRKKLRREKPQDIEGKIKTIIKVGVATTLTALAAAFAFNVYQTKQVYAKHNIAPVFDNAISAELASAIENPELRDGYIESIEEKLRKENLGKIRFLSDITYTHDGKKVTDHIDKIAKKVGQLVNRTDANPGETRLLTMGNPRVLPSTVEDLKCYVGAASFSNKFYLSPDGNTRDNYFKDADFVHAFAFHEAEHAVVEISGIPLPGFAPGEYKKATVPLRPNAVHRIEELWAYRQQLQQIITGKAPTSYDIFEFTAKAYGIEFDNVKLIRDRHKQPAARRLAGLVLDAVDDLTPLPNEPWLSYKPK